MDARYTDLDSKMALLHERALRLPGSFVRDFVEKLDISWIYHDNALEGIVLSYHELKAAIDKKIISDVTLIPAYEEIKNHKLAIEWVRDQIAKKKAVVGLDLLKRLHALVTPDEAHKGDPYRKENPLHRVYYHEIATPDKIGLRMRKLVEWLGEEETRRMHPVLRAARAHYRLMSIFPWSKNSGRVARLLMNLMLLRDGYMPAIIHAIERQRYYDVLRAENAGLAELVADSLTNSVDTALRYVQETEALTRPQRIAG